MNLIAQLGLSCLDYQATYTLYYSYWHNIGITHAIPKNIQVTEMIKKDQNFYHISPSWVQKIPS